VTARDVVVVELGFEKLPSAVHALLVVDASSISEDYIPIVVAVSFVAYITIFVTISNVTANVLFMDTDAWGENS